MAKAKAVEQWCECGLEYADPPSRLGRQCRLHRAARLREEAARDLARRGYSSTAEGLPCRTLDVEDATQGAGDDGSERLADGRNGPAPGDQPLPSDGGHDVGAPESEPAPAHLSLIATDPPDTAMSAGEAVDPGTSAPRVDTICKTCHQTFPTREACAGHQRWCGKPRKGRASRRAEPTPGGPSCEVCGYAGTGTLQSVNAHRFQAHNLRGTYARARPTTARGPEEHTVQLRSGRVTLTVEANIFELDERERLLIFGLVDRIQAYEAKGP